MYPPGYQYNFKEPHQDYTIRTADGNTLNGVILKSAKSKGIIFYLHGNSGALDTWKGVAGHYNDLGYDVFILDYPGYGKSTGHISSQQQFFDATKAAYDRIKQTYQENKIIIVGYSIGTGPAAWLASQNHPQKLILLAPYYSLAEQAKVHYPFLPAFLLKYPIETYKYIQHISAPIIIFHGDDDELIDFHSSVRLKKYFKSGDKLIILKGQQHNGIDDNDDYRDSLKSILQ